MTSNLSAFAFIPERAEAKPSLWNDIFSVLSSNIAAVASPTTLSPPSGTTISISTNLEVVGGAHFQHLSIGSTPPSYLTTAAVTIEVNSAFSDYLYLVDSSAQKSSYIIGSRAGGTADGLNIWDVSAGTMIVAFSKQSTRFYQNVVGPVFDTGGAVINVKTVGAIGLGTVDEQPAIQGALNTVDSNGGGTVFIPNGRYFVNLPLQLGANTALVMDSGASIIRNFSGGANVNATIRNKHQSSSGTDVNISISGGNISCSTVSNCFGKHVGLSYVSSLQLRDMRISGISGDWNMLLTDCSNVVANGLIIDSGRTFGEDGFHIGGGSNILLSNSYVRCGDDALAIVQEAGFSDTAITDVAVTNCVFNSLFANPLRIHTFGNMTPSNRSITRVNVTGCLFRGVAGGALLILDDNNAGLTNDIIVANCTVEAINSSISGVRQVSIAHMKVRQPSGPFRIDAATDITLSDVEIVAPAGASQCMQIATFSSATNIHLIGCHMKDSGHVGLQVGGGSGFTCTNFSMTGGQIDGSTFDGLYLSRVSTGRIVNVALIANAGFGIKTDSSCSNVQIISCDLRRNGSGAISDAGTGQIFAYNLGY